MTPEQYRAYRAEHAPRVIEFVRHATEPVWMNDVLNALVPPRQLKERDNMRSLLWDMVGPQLVGDEAYELVMRNDLSLEVAGADDDGGER